MAKRYNKTFKFFDTETQAKEFCDRENRNCSDYIRKKHPAHYTPRRGKDGTENKFIAWYVY